MKRHQDPIQPAILPKNGPNSSGRLFGIPGRSELLSARPPVPSLRSSNSDSGIASPAPISSMRLSASMENKHSKAISSGICMWRIGSTTGTHRTQRLIRSYCMYSSTKASPTILHVQPRTGKSSRFICKAKLTCSMPLPQSPIRDSVALLCGS